MGNPSPGSKLKKTTTPPPKTIHRRAPSVTSLSLDHSIGKDVASPEKSNGAGRSVASTPSSAGGSGEKGISPAVKDSKLRRRIRSSLGGSEDFVLGDDFNNAGTPPAEEKRITSPAEEKKSTPPPMEEKKHPFLLARGGIGRNGIRSGSPSQPLQSQAVKPRITTPPSKEKTALGRAASASTYSPKKLDMNSKKADKEVSLTKSATAKSVKVQGDSVAIGRPKQNQSVKLHATRKLVAGDNSCLPTSSDMLTSSKPDLGGSLISEPLASEDSTRPEIMESVEVPVYSEGEPEELTSMEVDHAEDDQLHLPILDTEEKTAAVSTNLQLSLEYAQEEPSVHRLKSETSFGQDNDTPNYLPSEEESNPQVNLEALHSSDTELTSACLTSLIPPSFQGIHVEQEGQVARPDYDFAGCPPLEEVTKFEEIQEGLESADTDESKFTPQTLQSIPSDLSGQKQGLNDTDVEHAVVSTMNHLSTCKLPDNASSAQEHQVDLHVADTRRSASTCAISSESSAFKLAGAQEEVFSRPAISEELRVSREDILTGFSSEVLSSPEVSHTPITQQEFGKIDASNNAVATFQQEVVGLPSDTSLEWSTTLDVDEDHDKSRDLNKAGSLCVALMPNLVCHSAEDSGSGGDVNQKLTAATRQNDLLYPSKDVESHTDVDLLEQDSNELRTGTTAFPLDALHEVILPLDNDQETYKNQLYTFHSGTLIDSLDGFHDVTSEQTTASSICTQETGIQAGTSVLAQQPELGLEEPPSITNANKEPSASMGMTPIMLNISPALDTSPELCNASPVLSAKQECEATSDSAASFFKETWSSSDDEGAAKISKELTSFASDAGDANFLTFSGEIANKDLGEAADIQDESCQDSVTRVMDLNRSVELLDCLKSEKGNSSRVQEVLEEGLTNDPENCKFAEEATHSVDEESTDCLLPKPLNCPKSENETSPKIQEISEEGLTNIPDKGACAEKARCRLDEGITHSLLQEPLDCLENCTSPELQELSEEGLTCIPDKAVACPEEARQSVDEGSTLSLLLEPLDCPKSENATSKNIQEVSDNGLANNAENGAHADEARHGVNEGRKAGLVQELLDSRNGTSPKIKEVSEEGVINTPEKGTCAEEATDSVGEGITPCLLQEQLRQKSGNNISPESQEVSEGVTITLENGTCAPETAHSVDEGSTSLLKESSLIPVEMGVGAPVVFAEDILRETGSAVQKDLIPADGGEPTKEVPHATGDVKAPAPAAGNVQPLHVDAQAEAVGVVLHQELGGDEKVSSTTAQDLLACEVLRDTDNVLGDLEMAADPGVAPSPMKPVETRPATVAGSDTVFGMEAGESPVSMDCMFGSAAEDTDEGQIERLDSIESLDPELSTEEDPGNLKDDESSGSSLLEKDLASFQGLVSLNDHADFTSDIAEKSDTSNMSEASLDMPEGGRVADVVLHLSTEHDPTIENSSAIPPQGPVMDRDPTLVVDTVATNTSMVVSSIPDNGERGEHHSDPVYLGESQKPEVSEVNLCKQEEDIAGEVAAHMTPPLETRHAPTLQDKSGFHPEESMVEDIVGKGVDPFAREVYLEAHPVETSGNEENLSCLNKLPTSHEANESDTMMAVATQDNFERHLRESVLEMLKDERSESNVKQHEQWPLEEQYMFVTAGSNDSAVSMESLDSSEALPMTNQEKREESSAEVLEILEDDRSDTALKEQEQRSFEEQPIFSTAESNDSDVLMGSLDNSEAFSVANLEKQEESSADTLEILEDDGFESEADYQEQRSLEEQPTIASADSNDSAVLMESLDNSETFSVANLEKQEESSADTLEMHKDDRFESEADYQEQRSLEEQPTIVSADSNDSAVLMESLDNSEAFSVANLEKQEESSADTLEMHRDDGFESEVDYQEQRSLEEQPMFISADSNYPAVLMENLDNTEPFPMTSQEKQQESSAEAPEMLEDDRPAIEVNYQEQRSLKEQLMFVAADSNDSAGLIESLNNSEALPVANQEKQEQSSAEALEMLEDARSEGEVSEREVRYVKEEQAMFVAANSNDSAVLMKSLHNSGAFPMTNQEKQEERTAEGPEMLEDARSEGEVSEQEVRYVKEEQAMFVAANSNDSAMLMKSLHNSGAFPMTNQEKQEERTAEGPEMLEDARAESEVIEQEQRSLEEKQSKVFAADHNDSALLTVSLDNSEAFPMNNQENQDGRAESKAIAQEQRSLEENESKVFAGDSNDTAVLTRSLDNSEAFPMTNQEKQDKSSAESLEMAEDDRLESEVSEEEQMVLEEQPMLVASDSHDSALVTENLDNPETFPVTNQEKQEESSAKALEMLQNNRSEMEAQEQEKSFLEGQSMFVAVDSNDSAVLTESLDNSEAFPVTNWEQQEESSAEALELPEGSRSESEVIEQEQRSAENERPMFVTADSNDSEVLMESLDNSKAFPVTNHEKQEETSACLEIPVDDRSEMEVQEQEKGSLGEQSIFVVADSNDPVTNQEKQEEVSAEGLEMLEVVRCENGLSEQEQRSVEEEQPMCVAADSAVLVEGLDNSDAVPVTIHEKQEESSAEGLEMLENDGSEMEVQEQEKGSLEEQPMFVAASSNDSAVLMESRDSSEALQVTNLEKQEESSAEAREGIEVGGFENEASEQEQRSIEEKQAMFGAADSNDSAVLTEGQDTSEALPVTNQEKQEESSAEAQEMIAVGRFEDEASELERRSVKEKQAMFGAADSNNSAVLMESQDSSEPLPMTDQEDQEESSAEAQEVIEVGGFENEAIRQEQSSVEEKQFMFGAADSNDSAVLTESQDTSEALPVTNQEMQEESSPEHLETLEDDRSENEIIQQEQRSVEEKQFMFGAADSNDSAVLIESQDSSEALPVTNQEKQEESSAEALEMVEVVRFENEASEQEQRSVEEKQTMFVAADSNDSAVLTESRDTSEALPVTIQEKQEESSAEPLMIEVASFENEASEQEQRSVEEKQTMFVGADSNDLAVLTESRDTSESFPFTNRETEEESSPEALEMLEDDRAESEIIQQEQRYLEEKQPIFVAADSNDSAVLMESLENSKPCPATNQEKQDESSAGTLEMLEDARFETEVNEQEKRSAEQPMSSDTNDATVLVESIDNSEAFPETNQEKQEESSAEVAADVLPSFQTSHVPAMQDSSVCPAKGLVTDDGVGEEVQPITSLGPVVPSGVTPENEVEELDNKEYSVSGYSTELFEELAKSEGFDRVNGMDEQGQMLASDEASQLYSQLQTRHVLSIQDSSFDQAEETVSDENVGEVVDPDSRHSLKGASPIITGGNEQEKRSGEADRSFDGNIDVGSVPETNAESIDLNKQNSPSQAEISCDGAQAQNNDLIMEVAALDCREPCEKVGHDDANGSETAETNNEALPLSGSRQPMEYSCNVSQASSPTYSINDEFPASHQNGIHRDSSSDVTQTQTADQDDSATGLKALPLPEKSCLMANGQSKSMVSALQASAPETADVHEAAPTLFPELGEQPLSSSHQDHLWEEQAETYPKGSGVTAAHLEEAAIDAIHSPTPSATSPDDQILPALGPVMNTLPDLVAHSSTVENGSTIDGKTEKGKSRIQLRNLLAEDASMVSNGSISTGAEDSPLKRLFSRLMGNPTKLGEKEIKQVKKRKPSVWNACLGVSAVR